MENQGKIMTILVHVSEVVTRIFFLNILWIMGVALGLGVFGLFPASIAVHGVLRKTSEFPFTMDVFHQFWRIYRQEFIKSNILGMIFFIIFLFFIFNIMILRNSGEFVSKIVLVGTYVLFFIYGLGIITLFPVYVRYDFKLLTYIKNAITIAMVQPLLTLKVIVTDIIIIFVSLLYPAFLFTLTMGSIFYMNNAILRKGILSNAELNKDNEILSDDEYIQFLEGKS